MSGGILLEDLLAKLPKAQQRAIARGSVRESGEIVGFNKKAVAKRILKRTSKSEHMLMMLEMARRELRMAEGLPLSIYPDDEDDDGLAINTSYRELLDLFPEKQQRAIERGARLLQTRYANMPAKYKTRTQDSYFLPPEGDQHMTFDQFLATMSKSEQKEFFREIREESDRLIALDRKKAQNKMKAKNKATSTSTGDAPASAAVHLSAKGK